MTFVWKTVDGKLHVTFIEDREERLRFIEWLETDRSVLEWR